MNRIPPERLMEIIGLCKPFMRSNNPVESMKYFANRIRDEMIKLNKEKKS